MSSHKPVYYYVLLQIPQSSWCGYQKTIENQRQVVQNHHGSIFGSRCEVVPQGQQLRKQSAAGTSVKHKGFSELPGVNQRCLRPGKSPFFIHYFDWARLGHFQQLSVYQAGYWCDIFGQYNNWPESIAPKKRSGMMKLGNYFSTCHRCWLPVSGFHSHESGLAIVTCLLLFTDSGDPLSIQ